MSQLRSGTPQAAGMSLGRTQNIMEMCSGWVDEGITPALSVVVARHGVIFLQKAWGNLTPEPDSRPVTWDSTFGLASVSKPVTATAAMQLIETGKIGIHQPVQKYLPELQGEGCEKIQVRHLLTHTSGLPYSSDADTLNIGEVELAYEPGKRMSYSNVGCDLLGKIIERVSGKPFHKQMSESIFEPLGMNSATFVHPGNPGNRGVHRRPGTNYDWPDELASQVIPSGTLWANALDMGIFAQAFLNGGSYGDCRLLGPATIAAMTRNQIPGIPREMKDGIPQPSVGFGWFMLDEVRYPNTACLWSPKCYGHAGASGAFIWIDPEYDLFGIFLFVKTNPVIHPVDLFVDSIMGAIEVV